MSKAHVNTQQTKVNTVERNSDPGSLSCKLSAQKSFEWDSDHPIKLSQRSFEFPPKKCQSKTK